MTRLVSIALGLVCAFGSLHAAEAKKLLVVSATVGPRDASIPNGEKMLRELAARSNGQFTVVMMSDAPDYPFSRVPVPVAAPGAGRGGGRGAIPGFSGMVPTLNPEQQTALTAAGAPIAVLLTAVTEARTALNAAAFNQPGEIQARVNALATAETSLALARATAFGQIQASANKLSTEQVQALAGTTPPAARGGAPGGRGGAPDNNAILARLFQEHFSAAGLRNYDGVIFLNSAGVLPIPDRDAFQRWVSEGRAVIAIHAAMNTGYETPASWMEMLSGGARYASSPGGSTTARKVYRVDATHPATRNWPDGIAIVDEYFQFNRENPADRNVSIPGIDRSKVRTLLDVDYEGERVAVSWAKMHGRGRVFYTSLGHRDDVMLPGTPAMEGNTKVNPDAVSAAYQAHVLNGILWATGIASDPNGK